VRKNLFDGEFFLAIGIIAAGLFFLLRTGFVSVNPGYARIGPRFFPYLVGGGLFVVGAGLAFLRLRKTEPVAQPSLLWSSILWLSAGLVLNVLMIDPAGYILATTVLFSFAAYSLGSFRHSLNVSFGFGLALATYFVFTRLLTIRLSTGWLFSF